MEETKFKIDWLEKKELFGKPAVEVSLESVTGKKWPKVTIAKFDKSGTEFPGFDTLMAGSELEGKLWNKPGTPYYSLFAMPKTKTPSYGSPRASQSGIKAAQERKSTDIAKAQENKNDSIRVSSTFRDATTLTNLQLQMNYEATSENLIKETWLKWRKWLLENYNVDVPF